MTINTKPRDAIVVNQGKHPEDYTLDEIINPDQKADLAQRQAQDEAQTMEGLAFTQGAAAMMGQKPYIKATQSI